MYISKKKREWLVILVEIRDCLPEELITEMCFEGQIEICNIGGKE